MTIDDEDPTRDRGKQEGINTQEKNSGRQSGKLKAAGNNEGRRKQRQRDTP